MPYQLTTAAGRTSRAGTETHEFVPAGYGTVHPRSSPADSGASAAIEREVAARGVAAHHDARGSRPWSPA